MKLEKEAVCLHKLNSLPLTKTRQGKRKLFYSLDSISFCFILTFLRQQSIQGPDMKANQAARKICTYANVERNVFSFA